MSQPISIPDELYNHLVEKAEKTRTSVETLVAHLLEQAIAQSPDQELLDQITQAYARGTTPPSAGAWEQIEAELAATVPPYESLKATMDFSRGRS